MEKRERGDGDGENVSCSPPEDDEDRFRGDENQCLSEIATEFFDQFDTSRIDAIVCIRKSLIGKGHH
jgi:hypothetical protein